MYLHSLVEMFRLCDFLLAQSQMMAMSDLKVKSMSSRRVVMLVTKVTGAPVRSPRPNGGLGGFPKP